MPKKPTFTKEVLARGVEIYLGSMLDVLPTLRTVDACVSDPPYGLGKWNNRGRNAARPFDSDATNAWDQPITAEHVTAMMKVSRYQMLWGANYFLDLLPRTKQMYVWNKNIRGMHFNDCEIAWCSQWAEACRVFDFSPSAAETKEHPTQKPLKLMEWCISMLPDGCTTVIDPFMGSGSTGVAAIGLGKKFIGVEMKQEYFDIARRRLNDALSKPQLFIDIPE